MVQTGKPRSKRPDGRLLSKNRQKKLNAEKDALMEAKDLKITKLSGKNRKTREVVMDTKEKTQNEKLLRALRKKMKAMLALKKKDEKGETLDTLQVEKLELIEETQENLEKLEAIMGA